MGESAEWRVGLGHDTHRLEEGRRLVIGGVEIDHHLGAVAHSDGDVLLHALTDAILGALGWGDIGEWFPDTAAEHEGADSAELLSKVLNRAFAAGWHINNVDGIVFAQKPKLSPYKEQIANRVAELLQVSAERVNVKAKTGEKVGPVGREEALCAEVVIMLVKKPEAE
ncbi:2-C-methyl-D-erythritol 2,4-cyclodiphosphate synthase [Thalassoglobus neptunius]|uniref:2-C-methyl-D-erythritol 2,4-cyclodiphosphate synthase n=1 Tax=Thalassoglobus neptunius TaxID=1938619 RepID=A0A5C5X7X2_9PLAN|nr:2-C-methyl-D-erythritol 2,4-cyclodiphosphate synthase [Thalassoglobus neptunius]TWT58373.1 2-C-methyl-D-erythritol 2,4-cyclodiphosphate synthase [Thalassoglobus neptunius]